MKILTYDQLMWEGVVRVKGGFLVTIVDYAIKSARNLRE